MPTDAQAVPELDDEAKALKKQRARERGYWIFFLIFSAPVLIGLYLVIRSQRAIHAEQAWAQAELAKAQPAPAAYGVRGAGLLADGKSAEALPLLEKAVAFEAAGGTRNGAKALMLLIEAEIDAAPDKVKPSLLQLERRAPLLAQGQSAAAWHAAGKLYAHIGAKQDAVRCLKKAVELQPDDWVQNPDGTRYKARGIASIYEKDLAGATLD